jgi:hypothetical protein
MKKELQVTNDALKKKKKEEADSLKKLNEQMRIEIEVGKAARTCISNIAGASPRPGVCVGWHTGYRPVLVSRLWCNDECASNLVRSHSTTDVLQPCLQVIDVGP